MKLGINFIFSIILFTIYILIGNYSFELRFAFGILYFFLYSYFVFRKDLKIKEKAILIFISLSPLFLLVYLHFVNFEETLFSLPSTLACFLGVFFGYLYSKIEKYRTKILFLSIAICLLIFVLIYGLDKYYNYIDFGSVSNNINEEVSNVSLFEISGFEVVPQGLHDSTVYFVWHNGCGVCKSLFPELENLSNRFKNSKTGVYALNIPFKEKDTFEFAENISKEYSFNKLYAKDKKIAETFGVHVYPTVIILMKNKIIFRGSFQQAIKYLS